MQHYYLLIAIWFCFASANLQAQSKSNPGNPWTFIETQSRPAPQSLRISSQRYAAAQLDIDGLKTILEQAPLWFTEGAKSKETVLSLPMPNGTFEEFMIQNAPVMAPELAEKYPEIRTYAGIGINDPTAYLRMSITPLGFNAIVFSAEHGTIFIDPYSSEDIQNYVVFLKEDVSQSEEWHCNMEKMKNDDFTVERKSLAGDCQFRTYDLALACTGEYAVAHGGTTELALAAMVTTITRVNGIFERDLSIHLNLVADNEDLIFLNPTADPYTNNETAELINQNQTTCDDIIGNENYDIGHVFSTAPGGKAAGNSVCNSLIKAKGTSGSYSPISDHFDFEIVAHEFGHQFGARHTFSNATEGSCADNNVEILTAFEPGSGSTILSYGGGDNCGALNNVQKKKDAYFHAANLSQIGVFVAGAGGTCANTTTMPNAPPMLSPLNNYTIPKSTPFVLEGSASDPNDSPMNLTYCWEQMDNDTTSRPPESTDVSDPLFRSFPPTKSPSRYFPQLKDILDNNSPTWEVLPAVSRTLNFRLTVRDNHIGGGCTADANTILTVDGASGPFVVTSPNTNVSWPALSTQNIEWTVAGTNVYCPLVDIFLSVDGGFTFPYQLKCETPNDGSESITLPNNQTEFARIMVRGHGNVFFDLTNADFTITTTPPGGSGGEIEWQNTIGGNSQDDLNSIQQTSDGGYILGGYSFSNISGDKTKNSNGGFDYWVVKLDSTGQNIQWQNTIGGGERDFLQALQQTSDGGYILGGYSISNLSGDKNENSKGGFDYWVVKLDASGHIQWQNTIGGSGSDVLKSLQQTSDGGYILGGWSSSDSSGVKSENSQGLTDYWIVKLDASGQNIQWQNTIGGSDDDNLNSIQQTSDGGYILGGHSVSNFSGDKTKNSKGSYDYWVVKLDASGQTIEWQNTIGGNSLESLSSIQQTSDGGYILGGYSFSNSSGDKNENSQGEVDYWVVKLDATGQTIEWQNTVGGSGWDALQSLQQTSEGDYILGGYSDSGCSGDKIENSQGGNDYWVVKLDGTGQTIEWQNTIGGSGSDYLSSIQLTSDGGYIFGGGSNSNLSGDKNENSKGNYDYWVVKLFPDCTSSALSFTTSNPVCNGSSTGSITVNHTGEESEYTYLWSNGETTRTISNLGAGAYTVSVIKTSSGCTSVATTVLSDPPALSLLLLPEKYLDGLNSGYISTMVEGGTGEKTYLWSTGSTEPHLINLSAGTYSVTVTDEAGCSTSGICMLVISINDLCPDDPLKTHPGHCGCGNPEYFFPCDDGDICTVDDIIRLDCNCAGTPLDSDDDGALDCYDSCPYDPLKVVPGFCGCGLPETDSDGDGTPDCVDNCLDDPNKTEPGLCGCGVPDTDTDGDGTEDCNDGCPNDPLKIGPGICGCGVPDTDIDGDGILDCNDGCPNDPNKIVPGICGCGVPDTDTDGDGTADCIDYCPNDPLKTDPGQCGCGLADTDTDADGTADCNDGCPDDPLKTDPGICGCGLPDIDGDGDGFYACDDCNDDNALVFPGAIEFCNNIDDNCNEAVDDGLQFFTYYIDSDGDGYGNPEIFTNTCGPLPSGYSYNDLDCNDNDSNINPGTSPGLTSVTYHTPNSVTVYWNSITGSTNYQIRYRLDGSNGAWTEATTFRSYRRLYSLINCTAYEIQFRNYKNAAWNCWSESDYFTTTGCARPFDPSKKGNENAEIGFQVFPNPTSDILNIILDENLLENSNSLILRDQLGRQIWSFNIQNLETNLIELNVRELEIATGVYTLTLQSEDGVMVRQVVVSH